MTKEFYSTKSSPSYRLFIFSCRNTLGYMLVILALSIVGPLPAAHAQCVVSNTTFGGGSSIPGVGWHGQTFTTTCAGTLTQATIQMGSAGSTGIVCEVRDACQGTILGTATTSGNAVAGTNTFTFSPGIPVANNTVYALELRSTAGGSMPGMRVVTTNVYAGGTYYYSGNTPPYTCTPVAFDFMFSVTIAGCLVLPTASISPVSPLYPMAGQEIQTVYLNYPASAQTVSMTGTASGGTAPYTPSWVKSGCNAGANPGTVTNNVTNFPLTFTATTGDACSGNNDNIHTFTFSVTDANGCVSNSVQKKINVVNPYDASGNVLVCHKVAVRGASVNQLVAVPASQVSAHTAHGDLLGNCSTFTGVKSLLPEPAPEQLVAIYPNPTTGIVILELSEIHESADVLITDMAGKIVAMRTIAKDATPTVTLDLSSLAQGMYLVSVKDGDFSYRTKLVVQ